MREGQACAKQTSRLQGSSASVLQGSGTSVLQLLTDAGWCMAETAGYTLGTTGYAHGALGKVHWPLNPTVHLVACVVLQHRHAAYKYPWASLEHGSSYWVQCADKVEHG